jgi:hypothetical protein
MIAFNDFKIYLCKYNKIISSILGKVFRILLQWRETGSIQSFEFQQGRFNENYHFHPQMIQCEISIDSPAMIPPQIQNDFILFKLIFKAYQSIMIHLLIS